MNFSRFYKPILVVAPFIILAGGALAVDMEWLGEEVLVFLLWLAGLGVACFLGWGLLTLSKWYYEPPEMEVGVFRSYPPDQLPILGFCLLEIQREKQNDPLHGWRWRMREQVVANCMALIRDGMAGGDPSAHRELSNEEKSYIRETHPLLNEKSFQGSNNMMKEFADWHAEIKGKVEFYAQRISG